MATDAAEPPALPPLVGSGSSAAQLQIAATQQAAAASAAAAAAEAEAERAAAARARADEALYRGAMTTSACAPSHASLQGRTVRPPGEQRRRQQQRSLPAHKPRPTSLLTDAERRALEHPHFAAESTAVKRDGGGLPRARRGRGYSPKAPPPQPPPQPPSAQEQAAAGPSRAMRKQVEEIDGAQTPTGLPEEDGTAPPTSLKEDARVVEAEIDRLASAEAKCQTLFVGLLTKFAAESKGYASAVLMAEVLMKQAAVATRDLPAPNPLRAAVACYALDRISEDLSPAYRSVFALVTAELYPAIFSGYSADDVAATASGRLHLPLPPPPPPLPPQPHQLALSHVRGGGGGGGGGGSSGRQTSLGCEASMAHKYIGFPLVFESEKRLQLELKRSKTLCSFFATSLSRNQMVLKRSVSILLFPQVRFTFNTWRHWVKTQKRDAWMRKKRRIRLDSSQLASLQRLAFIKWRTVAFEAKIKLLSERESALVYQLENSNNQFTLQCFKAERHLVTIDELRSALEGVTTNLVHEKKKNYDASALINVEHNNRMKQVETQLVVLCRYLISYIVMAEKHAAALYFTDLRDCRINPVALIALLAPSSLPLSPTSLPLTPTFVQTPQSPPPPQDTSAAAASTPDDTAAAAAAAAATTPVGADAVKAVASQPSETPAAATAASAPAADGEQPPASPLPAPPPPPPPPPSPAPAVVATPASPGARPAYDGAQVKSAAERVLLKWANCCLHKTGLFEAIAGGGTGGTARRGSKARKERSVEYVTNFGSDWASGEVYIVLLNHVAPSVCFLAALQEQQRGRLAFVSQCGTDMGLKTILRPSDISSGVSDLNFCFLAELFAIYANRTLVRREADALRRAAEEEKLQQQQQQAQQQQQRQSETPPPPAQPRQSIKPSDNPFAVPSPAVMTRRKSRFVGAAMAATVQTTPLEYQPPPQAASHEQSWVDELGGPLPDLTLAELVCYVKALQDKTEKVTQLMDSVVETEARWKRLLEVVEREACFLRAARAKGRQVNLIDTKELERYTKIPRSRMKDVAKNYTLSNQLLVAPDSTPVPFEKIWADTLAVLRSNFQEIQRVFKYYSSNSADASKAVNEAGGGDETAKGGGLPSHRGMVAGCVSGGAAAAAAAGNGAVFGGVMTATRFWKLVGDMKCIDKELTTAVVGQIFTKVNVVEGDAFFGGMDAAENPDTELVPLEFSELLIRFADVKIYSEPLLNERVEQFLQRYVFPNTARDHVEDQFRTQIFERPPQKAIQKYSRDLYYVFKVYCNAAVTVAPDGDDPLADPSLGDGGATAAPVTAAAPLTAGGKNNMMSVSQFLLLLSDLNLLMPPCDAAAIRSIFTTISSRSMSAASEPSEKHTSAWSLAGSHGPSFAFHEFIEAVVACSVYRLPCPYAALEKKIERFVTADVILPLRPKFKTMGIKFEHDKTAPLP